jgi:hypothetical protein
MGNPIENKRRKIMKRSIASYASAALVFTMLAFVAAPASGADVFQIPAIKIPNSSILPNNKVEPVPLYIGQPATPQPISGTMPIPQNPFMALDPWSCIHNDSYQSDVYPERGTARQQPCRVVHLAGSTG